MHTAVLDVLSETPNTQHGVWLWVFHYSNPKSQSKTPGHKPVERENEGNVQSHPFEAKLLRDTAPAQPDHRARWRGSPQVCAFEFIMWTHPLGQQQRWIKRVWGHITPSEGHGQDLVLTVTAPPAKKSPFLRILLWNDKRFVTLPQDFSSLVASGSPLTFQLLNQTWTNALEKTPMYERFSKLRDRK